MTHHTYLVPENNGGLTNQLVTLYAAAAVAAEYGWTLVLPTWSRPSTWHEHGPFKEFYTLNYTVLEADPVLKHLAIVDSLPQPAVHLHAACDRQRKLGPGYSSESAFGDLLKFAANDQVVCPPAGTSFFTLPGYLAGEQ